MEIVKIDHGARTAGAGDQLTNIKVKQVIIHEHSITIERT